VIAQLESQPLVDTGLTFDYHSPPNTLDSLGQAARTAVSEAARLSGPAFARGHPIVWDPIPVPRLPHSGLSVSPTLVAADGACRQVVLQGDCPTSPGQIAVLKSDADALGLQVGSRIRASAKKPYVVTALYEPSASGATFWFGNGRLQSIPASGPPKNLPARPAPWITVAGTIHDRFDTSWYVTVDQRLALPADLTPSQVDAAGARAAALTREADHDNLPLGFDLEPGNSLYYDAHRLLARRGVVGTTVTPAVVSLIVVTMVLLVRLLSAAMDARRGELALAALRGYERRQLWLLGMIEPLLIVAAAIPVGIAAGYVGARLLALAWLAPGLPVRLPWGSVVGVAGVVAVAAVFAAIIVLDALNEPLAAQIAGVRRPVRPRHALVILRLMVTATAIAVLVTALSRHHTGPRTPPTCSFRSCSRSSRAW
jgi:hypothetical protein